MKNIQRKTGNEPSVAKVIALSAFVSLIIMFAGTALVTALVSSGTIEENALSGIVWVVLFLSSLAGSFVAKLGSKDRGVIAAVGGAAIFYLILICMNIVLFDGQFTGILWGTIFVLMGALAGVIVKNIPFFGGRKGKYKYRYR